MYIELALIFYDNVYSKKIVSYFFYFMVPVSIFLLCDIQREEKKGDSNVIAI